MMSPERVPSPGLPEGVMPMEVSTERPRGWLRLSSHFQGGDDYVGLLLC